eukprot:TRINITY_DN2437_c0_g1_i1.p1 TRINITY_DN2437_c0_g1~~TRINITY_DN2437_c0_g1_i1.p1  ORF type:complete len:1057 (-),score=369.20 TRINITY_DN2437_c0_g1_i1:131-3301(-)
MSDDELDREEMDEVDEEGEEEEEEEEEEDDVEDKRNPKKPRNAGYYIDEFAEVDEDDDEEEEDDDEEVDGFLDKDEISEDRGTLRAAAIQLEQQRNAAGRKGRGFADLIDRIEKRGENYDDDEAEDVDADDDYDDDYGDTQVARQGLLPSVRDPKLWRVNTKPGREKDIVCLMMNKFFERSRGAEPLLIKSVVAPEHLPGYIYVEAEKEIHVKEAIKGIRNVYQWQVHLVRIQEMPDVLTSKRKAVVVERGSWVRIKRGDYKGDIGQVVDFDQARGKGTIRLIPRLDYAEYVGEGLTAEEKRKRKTRMPARFFNPDEAVQHAGSGSVESKRDLNTGEWQDHFAGMRFKDGYLLKQLNIKSLDVNNIVPTIDELTRFQDRSARNADGETDANALDEGLQALSAPLAASTRRNNVLRKGDVVKVIEGDLKHLMGVVESVDDDAITIMPRHEQLTELLQFPSAQLQRYFKVGDHVKVVSGKYHGQTGMVVKIDDLVAIVHSDLTNADIKVLISDIQEATEVTSGRLELGNYELHDIVQIEANRFGVIVRVDQSSFIVLDQHGTPVTIDLKAMGPKRHSRDAVTMDKFQNQLHQNDIVQVLDGPHRRRTGTIKHIMRYFVWCYSREYLENGGIFVVRAQSCQLMGAKAKAGYTPASSASSTTGRAPPQSPRHLMSGGGGQRTGASAPAGNHYGGAPRRKGADPLLNKTVVIKTGVWKGYLGIVKDCTDTTARVELHTKSKTINVARENLHETATNRMDTSMSDHGGSYFGGAGSATPMWGGRTPMRDDGTMTPLRNAPMTPSRGYGSDVWNPVVPNTPLRPQTPSYEGNDWTPSSYSNYNTPTPRSSYLSPYSPATPGMSSDGTPTTPGYSAYDPHTPSSSTPSAGTPMSNTPGMTPYNMPTPATPLTPNIPQTPATPMGDSVSTPYEEASTPGYVSTPAANAPLNDSVWAVVGIEVTFKASYAGGKYSQAKGAIVDVDEDGVCAVTISPSGERVSNVPQGNLVVVVPNKRDRVTIIAGEVKGAFGSLIGVYGQDGIVRLDGTQDIKILPMPNIARLAQQ